MAWPEQLCRVAATRAPDVAWPDAYEAVPAYSIPEGHILRPPRPVLALSLTAPHLFGLRVVDDRPAGQRGSTLLIARIESTT